MRYAVQLLIPALIFASVVYLLTRQRRHQHDRTRDDDAATNGGGTSDVAAFIAILALGATVALGSAYLLTLLWE